jgi:hypothetical protein
MNKNQLYIFLLVVVTFIGCKKTDTLTPVTINDIYPLQVGKNYYYRLDSTVLANLNQQLVVHSYNAKDSVDLQFTDNTGRRSYRIFRYIRDTFNLQAWQYTATYYATFDTNRVEYNDNNLRYVTLVNNVEDGNQWLGTQYINTTAPFDYLYNWTFQYQNSGQPYTVKKGVIQNTYTVLQQDEDTPDAPFDPNSYHEHSYSIEVYAKGIGLIYKDFLHWTWQPPTSTFNIYYQTGSFGVRLNLMDYK